MAGRPPYQPFHGFERAAVHERLIDNLVSFYRKPKTIVYGKDSAWIENLYQKDVTAGFSL
jgi:hypothetical protein